MIHNLASSKTIGVGDARMSLSYAQSHEYVVSMWINDLHVRDLTTHDNVNAALASARSTSTTRSRSAFWNSTAVTWWAAARAWGTLWPRRASRSLW